jgi:hypothetical protein
MKQMMPIFGWSEDKAIHRVRLPKGGIVEAGIHPWLVDVFDPDPVVLKVYDMPLAFTRLRKFSLAYTLDGTAYLMVKDNGLNLSLVGPYKKQEGNRRLFIDRDRSELSTNRIDFQMHLRSYLGVHENPLSRSSTPAKFIHCGRGSDDTWLGLENRTIRYANSGPYPGYRFGGEMLEQRTLIRELPAEIERVFEVFTDFKPVIFGPALGKALMGQDIDGNVDFTVVPSDSNTRIIYAAYGELDNWFHKIGAQNIVRAEFHGYGKKYLTEEDEVRNQAGVSTYLKFQLADVTYRLFVRGSDAQPVRNWIRDDFSVHQIQCQRSEHDAGGLQVTASRIALWDLGHKQARWVNSRTAFNYDLSRDNARSPVKMQLKQSGFNVADIVWHKRDGAVLGKA